MNGAERERYSRQILFRGIGEQGQEALLSSRAVIAGCGIGFGRRHSARALGKECNGLASRERSVIRFGARPGREFAVFRCEPGKS